MVWDRWGWRKRYQKKLRDYKRGKESEALFGRTPSRQLLFLSNNDSDGIEYQFLSTFQNLTYLKNKIAESEFKINIIEEKISRENANSDKVLASGKIGVYVFPGKEKLLKDKSKIIEIFKAEEEKLAEKEKQETEN